MNARWSIDYSLWHVKHNLHCLYADVNYILRVNDQPLRLNCIQAGVTEKFEMHEARRESSSFKNVNCVKITLKSVSSVLKGSSNL